MHGFVVAGIPIGWNEIFFIGGSIFFLCVAHWCVFFSVVMLASSVGISKESPDFIRIQNAFADMEDEEEKFKDRKKRSRNLKNAVRKHIPSKNSNDMNVDDPDGNDDDDEEELADRYSFRSGAVYLVRSVDVLRPKIKGGAFGLLASVIYAFYAYKSIELPVLILLTTCVIMTGIRSAFKFGELWNDKLEEHAEMRNNDGEEGNTNG